MGKWDEMWSECAVVKKKRYNGRKKILHKIQTKIHGTHKAIYCATLPIVVFFFGTSIPCDAIQAPIFAIIFFPDCVKTLIFLFCLFDSPIPSDFILLLFCNVSSFGERTKPIHFCEFVVSEFERVFSLSFFLSFSLSLCVSIYLSFFLIFQNVLFFTGSGKQFLTR